MALVTHNRLTSLAPIALVMCLVGIAAQPVTTSGDNEAVPHVRPVDASRQLVLVVTPAWDAVDGQLQRYERTSTAAAWRSLGLAVPIVVGRSGMAWGIGLHGAQPAPGPVKVEGDGRSPAGVFSLVSAFGFAPSQDAARVKLPYTPITATSECVDDPASASYNRILDRAAIASPDWTSSEKMRAVEPFYRWGVAIDQNPEPSKPSGGSCVFLHIWEGTGRGTAGCTALDAGRMEELLFWLDPRFSPVLVQAPRPVIDSLRAAWHLP